MKKKIIAAISAVLISLSIAIPVLAVDTPTSWDDLTEDAQAVGTAYANAFSQYLNGDFLGGALSFRDVPLSYYKFITDLGWCISPVDDVYYYLVNGELYVDDTNYSGGGGFHNPSHSTTAHHAGKRRVSSDEDVVSDKQFYQSIVTKNPSPITVGGRISIRSSLFSDSSAPHWFDFYREGTFTHENYRELYMIPFFYNSDSDKYYYSTTQYHYFQHHGEKDSNGLVPIYLDANTSSIFSPNDFGDVNHSHTMPISQYKWVRCRVDVTYCTPTLYFFDTYENYLKAQTMANWYWCYDKNAHTFLYDLSDISLSTYIDFRDQVYGYNFFTDENSHDVGYLISDEPFYFTSSINFNNIPDSVIIYPSGGDIYIDDTSDNKQGDTVYNYIYNNYVFNTPDNPSSDDDGGDEDNPSGGSGTTSGDITVSGRVEVGGEIVVSANPIDININVNSGSSGSHGTFEAAPSYIDGKDVELDKYLELAPEMSDGFIDFVQKSLAWLPAEILGLLILGLVIAVWLRIVGR